MTFGNGVNTTTGGTSYALTINAATTTGSGNVVSGSITGGGSLSETGAGTLTLTGANTYTGSTTVNAGTLAIGNGGGINGSSLSVVGGATFALSGTGGLSAPNEYVGFGSPGTFTQSGGTNTVSSLSVDANGLYTLSGGVLQAGSVSGGAGTSTFHFNGGTLVAETSTTSFFSGLTTADVQAGGALINTAGNNVTVAQALASGTASGTPDGGLTKLGAGTLTLTGTNTFTGPLNIDGGVLAVAAESNLGAQPGAVTAGGGGELLFTGSATLGRVYNLGFATLGVASGSTLTYASGATVNGGFLGAGGTHAFTNGASLYGATAAANSTLTASGTVTFVNDTVRGSLTPAAGATLNATDTTVTSAGSLAVNGTVNTSRVEIDGVTAINSGGSVANSGGALTLGPGSRTTLNGGGTLSTASGTTIELNDGLLVNNGTQNGTLDVNYGATASGSGSFGNVNVNPGGKFGSSSVAGGGGDNGLSAIRLTGGGGLAATNPLAGPQPSAMPGITTVGGLTLNGGATRIERIQDASAAAGVGYDLVIDSGTLTLNGSPTNQIIVSLSSLNASGNPGMASNFDPTKNYQFTLVEAGSIVGYTGTNEFDVDTSGFANALAGGSFSVVESGNNLVLDFTAVPEPGTCALLAAGGGLLLTGLARSRRPGRA